MKGNREAEKMAFGPPKVLKWIDGHFEESLLILLLATMACVELVQVIARNVPFMPTLTWAEEFCRFTWIATVFLSLPYTIRTMTMLRVTALLEVLPWKVQNIINIVVDIITVFVLVVLSFYSIEVTGRIVASGETSPAMLLPMWIMYAIVVSGFVLGALRSVQMCIIHCRNINVKPQGNLEAQVEEELDASGMAKMTQRIVEANADENLVKGKSFVLSSEDEKHDTHDPSDAACELSEGGRS